MNHSQKPALVMLAAHEPFDDPRVDWAAKTAAELFDVTVLGLSNQWSLKEARALSSEMQDVGPYRIWRFIQPVRVSAWFIGLLGQACAERLLKPARSQSRWLRYACLPLLCCVEVAIRIVAWTAMLPIMLLPRTSWRMLAAMPQSDTAIEKPAVAIKSPLNKVRNARAKLRIFRDTVEHILLMAETFYVALNNLPKRPTVVYCHDLNTLLPGVLFSMGWKTPVLYDAHEYWPYLNLDALPLEVVCLRRFERILIHRARAVFTVSDTLAREMESVYGLPKVHVLPNAEPWVEQPSATPLVGEITKLAAGRVRFLFQGHFAPERGLEELLEAWTQVDASKATLFLRGPDSPCKQEIIERARALGVLDRSVFVVPPVSVAELVAAGREADVGVIPYKPDYPAYRFACPNKLSQYLHAGVAILANKTEYVARQVTVGQCGLIYESKNRDSIVSAVMRMAEDKPALELWKKNALEYGRNTFNWQVQGQPLRKVLRKLAEDGGSRSTPTSVL